MGQHPETVTTPFQGSVSSLSSAVSVPVTADGRGHSCAGPVWIAAAAVSLCLQ